MQIDMFTAVLCYLASNVVALLSAVFILKNNNSFKDGIKAFVFMYILLVLGSILILLREVIPIYLTITVGNFLGIFSKLFLFRAISKLLGKKYNSTGVLIIIVFSTVLLAYFTYFNMNLQARIITLSTAQFLINMLLLIYVSRKDLREHSGAGCYLAISAIYMIINTARVILILLFAPSTNNLMNLSIDPIIVLVEGLFSLIMIIALLSIISGIKTERLSIKSTESNFFAKIYEISPTAILVAKSNDCIMYVNQSLCDLTMQQCESIKGSDWISIFIPEKNIKQIWDSIHGEKKKTRIHHTAKILKYDGVSVPVEFYIDLHYDEFKILDYYYVYIHDLTLINKIQQKAIEAERQKSSILANIPGFTYKCLMDRDWTMLELSDGFTEMTGYDADDLIGNKKVSFNDLIAEEYKEEVWENWNYCYKEKVPYVGEYKLRRADGSTCWIWEHGRVVEYHDGSPDILEGFITDVSKRKELEERNIQMEAYIRNQQKMEAIGILAAGVAHEINNPVNGILNYAQLISDVVPPEEDISEYAHEIISESERVSGIVSSLLHFSGNSDLGPQLVDIGEIFMQTIDLFKAMVKQDNISLNISFEANIPPVVCDCSKMQQVLMNLLTNAKEALNIKYPGTDENKIINIDVESMNDNQGDWVRITVEDNGPGIPDEVKRHIFEPFFTTKERPMSSGLGLSVSYGIVREHNGRLTFESDEGNYTRFFVDMPVR